jgi:hypothetical protein
LQHLSARARSSSAARFREHVAAFVCDRGLQLEHGHRVL